MPHGAPTDGGQVGLVLLCLGSTAFGHPGEGPSRDLLWGLQHGLVGSKGWFLRISGFWHGLGRALRSFVIGVGSNTLSPELPNPAYEGSRHSIGCIIPRLELARFRAAMCSTSPPRSVHPLWEREMHAPGCRSLKSEPPARTQTPGASRVTTNLPSTFSVNLKEGRVAGCRWQPSHVCGYGAS